MRAKFENVKVEEAKGQVSSKDASKYYGSVVLKYKDPETKKNESLDLRVSNPFMVQELEKHEVNEDLLDVIVFVEQRTFSGATQTSFGDILEITVVS
jgi:hypothetical protein